MPFAQLSAFLIEAEHSQALEQGDLSAVGERFSEPCFLATNSSDSEEDMTDQEDREKDDDDDTNDGDYVEKTRTTKETRNTDK